MADGVGDASKAFHDDVYDVDEVHGDPTSSRYGANRPQSTPQRRSPGHSYWISSPPQPPDRLPRISKLVRSHVVLREEQVAARLCSLEGSMVQESFPYVFW